MALIVCEPKDIDLYQLESELGVQGINVCYSGDEMLVEAECSKKKLETAVADHTPDPALAAQRASDAQAQAEQVESERQVKRAALEVKLEPLGITLDDLREALA